MAVRSKIDICNLSKVFDAYQRSRTAVSII